MARPTHRVMPRGNEWIVKKDGADRAAVVTDNKAEAVKEGRQISKNQGTEFQIHGKDMKIQSSDSHGHDPCPPKDKD